MASAARPAELCYRTAGPLPGTELLLVHGMSSSSRYWGANLGPLAQRYRVVAPDLLGFGHSPKPESAYSPHDHAVALADIARQAGAPVVVVGHSLGSLLALQLAVEYPQLVSGLVLISLPCFGSEAEARRQLARSSLMARLQIEHPRSARLFCWAVCHARPVMRALMPLLEYDVDPEVARAAVDHTWESASGTVAGVILHTRPAALLHQVPSEQLLFIHASDDRTAPLAPVQTYVQNHPGAELALFPSGGHHPYLRHQEATCGAIARFADQLLPRFA